MGCARRGKHLFTWGERPGMRGTGSVMPPSPRQFGLRRWRRVQPRELRPKKTLKVAHRVIDAGGDNRVGCGRAASREAGRRDGAPQIFDRGA